METKNPSPPPWRYNGSWVVDARGFAVAEVVSIPTTKGEINGPALASGWAVKPLVELVGELHYALGLYLAEHDDDLPAPDSDYEGCPECNVARAAREKVSALLAQLKEQGI